MSYHCQQHGWRHLLNACPSCQPPLTAHEATQMQAQCWICPNCHDDHPSIKPCPKLLEMSVEIAEYRLALNHIWNMCLPNRKGHFRKGVAQDVLRIASDAVSYPERQMVAVLSKKVGL